MNAHRPLKPATYRIIIQPGKRIRLYANPSLRDVPGMLESGPHLANTKLIMIRTADNWIISRAHGGFPVMKEPGLRSLEEAWEYELVEIERQVNGRYVPVEGLGEL
jgi:hypothetical protein